MAQAFLAVGKGLLWMVCAVGFGVGWAALVEAKNCTLQAGNCACGDTLVQNGTIGSAQTFYCYDVDQALKIADNVTLDCSHSWVMGNYRAQSAGFRLGHGSRIDNCWVGAFEIAVKFDGWYGMMVGGGADSVGQEGLHFSNGVQGNYVGAVWVRAPQEALYFQGSHYNLVEWSSFIGSPATYTNNGASGNHVRSCDFTGGANRSNFSAAGSNNHWEANDYHGGAVRSLNGSQYPNYVGPSPNATIQNTDGSLYVY